MSAHAHDSIRKFAITFSRLFMDNTALRRASKRDLAVVEGMLLMVLDSVTAELKRRDGEKPPTPGTGTSCSSIS